MLLRKRIDNARPPADDRAAVPVSDANATLPLSVAIVCRNNERTIGRTLASVKDLASEIVAVDSGSTDGTIALLENAGATIIRSAWLGHIRTKQTALDACTQEWVLALDSDESLEPTLADSIRKTLVGAPIADGFEINRKVWWDGVWLNHAWQPEWRLRLVRRGKFRWGGYDPHDALEPADGGVASVTRLAGDMRHESFTTMAEHLAAQARYAEIAAESYLKMGRRTNVWKMTFNPVSAFLKQLILRQAFRDGWRGWAAAGAVAATTLMKHLVLLERQRMRKDKP